METIRNPQRSIVRVWTWITILFVLGMLLPNFVDMDMMNGGFALMFLSGFMVIIGIIVIVIYNKRANELDKLLKGDKVLIHWKYGREEWEKYTEYDFRKEKKQKWLLFRIVAVISLIIGILLSILAKDILFLWICLGIIVMIAITAFITSRTNHSRNVKHIGEVLISRESLYLNGMFHNWNMLNARLESVSLNLEVQPAILKIVYSYPARSGREEAIVRVPVPAGKEEEAKQVASKMIA